MLSTKRPNSSRNRSYILLICGTAALGGFLFGFDTAVINGAVAALQGAFAANSVLTGLAVSLALLGSAVGAFYAGQISDRWGRVRAMILASLLFTVSAIGSGFAIGIGDFIVWRFLGGIAVGAASVIAPAYIAEVSPAHLRGRMGSLQQLAIVVGIFIALLSNYFIAISAGSAELPFWFGVPAWRWMFWAEVPPAVLYGLAALRIPESPRFLVAQGREPEAATVLTNVYGAAAPTMPQSTQTWQGQNQEADAIAATAYAPTHPGIDIAAKIQEIRETVFHNRTAKLSDLISRSGGLLPIVWLGMGLSVFQQFVGINVIFYYSSILWRSVGFTEADSLWITVITSVTNIVTTLVAIAFVDKFGRKPLLILGSIGMTLTLGTMSTVFANAAVDAAGNPVLAGNQGIVALVAANLYVFCFGFSWGPIVWVLLGEMFNNRIRAVALAVCAAVQWIANFLVSTTFPPLLESFGLGTAYGLYATAAAISFFFVWLMVKETKGKELEEM